MISANAEKEQVTIIELTEEELADMHGGWHDRYDHDRRFDGDRRFGFRDSFSFRESFSFHESFRFRDDFRRC